MKGWQQVHSQKNKTKQNKTNKQTNKKQNTKKYKKPKTVLALPSPMFAPNEKKKVYRNRTH